MQFQSDAQNTEDAAISYSWIDSLPIVSGKFGHEEVKDLFPTCSVNEKVGVNASALYEYIKEAILVLYPDISDEPGKCAIAKIDGGPGRFHLDMLAELCMLGFYIVPSCPNVTHICQEQDWLYGVFKSLARAVIGLLYAEYYSAKDEQGKVRQTNRSNYGVIINGQEGTAGKEPIVSPFRITFTTERNINA
eukprot:6499470-Ditylum_brightwellii.AAC.1